MTNKRLEEISLSISSRKQAVSQGIRSIPKGTKHYLLMLAEIEASAGITGDEDVIYELVEEVRRLQLALDGRSQHE